MAAADQVSPWLSQAIAPNGLQVRDNFRAWFGDSAIRRPDGAPIIVTHGTTTDFDAFKVRAGAGCHGPGIYMAVAPPGDGAGYGDRTLELVVRMCNPFIWNRSEDSYDALVDGEMLEAVLGPEQAERIVERMDDLGIDEGYGTELVDELRRRGHDGLLIVPPGAQAPLQGGDVLVAWEASQMKLVYGNSGVFSSGDSLSDEGWVQGCDDAPEHSDEPCRQRSP